MASYCCAPLKACCKCCGTTATKSGCTPQDCFCAKERPTIFFLGFNLFFHVVPGVASLVIGIISLRKTSCFAHDSTNLGIFLLIDALLGLLFILFALRVQSLLAKPYEVKDHKKHACGCHPEVYSRIGQFLWKDVSFLIFIILAVFAIVWNVIGLIWSGVVDEQYNFRYRTVCYVGIVKMARAAASVMFSYLTFVPFAFLLTICIESYRKRPDLEAADPEAPEAPASTSTGAKTSTAGGEKADVKAAGDQGKPSAPPAAAGGSAAPSAAMQAAATSMQQAAEKSEEKPAPPAAPSAPPATTQAEPAIGIPVNMYPPVPANK